GPDHDARADRQYLAALAAGEVDPLVERAAAGERIGPLAEARRDVPRRDRTAAGSNLVRELAVQQKILEDVELAGPVLELQREAVQRAQDSAQIELVDIGEKLLRAAERRRGAEVELAVIEPRHLREPRAERVEPDDVRVHLAEPERERVDAPLQAPAGLLEQRLLRLELGAPGLDLRARIRDPVRIGRAPPYVKCEREEAERERARGDPDPARGEVQLRDVTAVSVEEDQFHPARPPLDACVLLFRNR